MLRTENLGAAYVGGLDAISGITLDIRPGEVLAVLGANGAGKSTLLRAIMGLMPRMSGNVYGPEDVLLSGLPTHRIARHGVAYVPEGRGILYSLDVRENLLVGGTVLESRGEGGLADRIEQVLVRFPILRERFGQRAGSLSGGQQQMLAIGRALISRPRVLLLDEPSLGLAPLIRKEIAETLVEIAAAERLAVLLVEQDIKTAQRCARRALVLQRGEIVDEVDIHRDADVERLRHAYLGAGKLAS